MRAIVLYAASFGFFCLLSGQFHSTFLMVAGAITCAAITLLALYMGTADSEGLPARYWWRTVLYVPWLMWQIVLSNIDVAKRVWNPKMPIAPCTFRIAHELQSTYAIATYANSITLTPGTVTVTIGPRDFLIHALTQEAADDLKSGEMHRRVQHIDRAGT